MAEHKASCVGGLGGLFSFDPGSSQGVQLHCELFAILQAHLPDMNPRTQQRCISIHARLMLDRLAETRIVEKSNRQRLSSLYQQHRHDQGLVDAAVTAWAGAQRALTALAALARRELAKLDAQAWSLGLDRCGMPNVPHSASQSRQESGPSNHSAISGMSNGRLPVRSIRIVARPRSPVGDYGGDNDDHDVQTTDWGRMLPGATACTVTHKLGRCTKVVHSVYRPASPHRLDVYSVETVPVSGPVSGH